MLRSCLVLSAAALLVTSATACGDETTSGNPGGPDDGAGNSGNTGNSGTGNSGNSGEGGAGNAGGSGNSGNTGTGGSSYVCEPDPGPDSIYNFASWKFLIDSAEPTSMCEYRGEVMLFVNTAAKCGYTPQYEGLEALHETYSAQGLNVLGFLSDDFFQAGSDTEIEDCTEQYGVLFEQFGPVHVKINPPEGTQEPVFGWLTSQPGMTEEVDWNFNKWLVGRDGTLIARWTQGTEPEALIPEIEAALAEPAPNP